ncbi:hypothetical protein N0V93_006087 [Gnomoniopsis smithogilvyi]|uniref:lytic cellulose monooxygenase (C4-dehydrogenating) n=1 Tax=Gnomoniopsis smithogilvyi TaxID=1191159 RepID=A0A9W8YMM3_9PEZI|nr:hypothetical protein N0V93_006087 [Gnomoniopsis smithogilvyi]
MRSTFACVAAFASTALAHYNFEALIVNDNVTSPYEYVRQTTNSNSPITDVTSQDFICNAGGLDADIMAKTSTYTVQAGDSVGFTINSNIGHPGPLHVYMSKAPDSTTAQDYKGAGDWFKVYSLTTSSITDEGLQWATYVDGGINNFTFALPEELAAGEYLMRVEHIALHGASTKGGAQFYMGCAQLKVEGSGTSTPTDTVSIPGVYDGTEPGILLNIYYPVPTNYTDPGPVTWPNGCEDHTANFVGQTSDGDCTGSTGSSSSSGSATTTGSASGSSASATATASGSGSSATGSAVVSAAGVNSGSSSSSSSSDSSSDSCASKRKRRVANKKRAEKHGLGLMRD